ncbi:hypothetical protein RDWZM_003921 [Blomia tropicalis]|uniref:B-cell lymphoma 9 beta-catenin binding domain-containing protein n=1 Tax=Blomia tropicalis TaxID=40697 RepID=A0A9Q0MGB4_BLOTA|nr:hypothetical protein RDWZM_003921 [Blomia tropicalis]
MNILDKQSPTNGPPSGSGDCLLPNTQMMPSMVGLPPSSSSTGPSSVSSCTSAPHTPIDSLNSLNCPTDLNGLSTPTSTSTGGGGGNSVGPITRPNVSTPSSVFGNSSAPNTPMPCQSLAEGNMTSPSLNQLNQMDYGDPKQMFQSGSNGGNGNGNVPSSQSQVSGPPPPNSQQSPLAQSQQQQQSTQPPLSGMGNPVQSPSSINQQQPQHVNQQQPQPPMPPMCPNESMNMNNHNGPMMNNNPPPLTGGNGKKSSINCNGSNKKHCNNRNNQQQQVNSNNFANIKCENGLGAPMKSPMGQFGSMGPQGPMGPGGMSCNGGPPPHLNGNVSPFDLNESDMIGPPIGNSMQRPSVHGHHQHPSHSHPSSMNMPPNMINNVSNHHHHHPHQSTVPLPNNKPPPPSMGGYNNGPMPPHGPPQPPPSQQQQPPMIQKPPPMDSQYMQHQSQIFVFNTILANQAADAVDSGQFPTIIDFHLANPHTKSFLEKHSLKIPNQKMNNMWPPGNGPPPPPLSSSGMGAGGIRQPRMRGPNPNGPNCIRGTYNNPCVSQYNHNPPGPGPGGGPGSQWNGSGPMNQWAPNQQGPPGPSTPQQPQFSSNDMNMKMPNCGGPRPPYGGPPQQPPQSMNPNMNSPHYSLGGDMQDSNLTPQQKQHREKQLAILANLQQKFCPELMDQNVNQRPLSQPSQSNEFGDSMGSGGVGGPQSHPSSLLSNENELNQMIPSDQFNNSPFPPMNQSNDQWPPPKSASFVDDAKPFTSGGGRRKGSQSAQAQQQHQSPMPPQPINSPNSCIASSPGNRVPPPPYNQVLNRSISSPHPASPAGTSLSLPSPRTMHTNDGSRQPGCYTPGGRSGPATPSADNPNCGMINSPKSTSRTNTSPGATTNKKSKQQSASMVDNDPQMNMMNQHSSFGPKSEPALMPVPSPKQIDYINTFEGHELTIHKQPNAHFQDGDLNDLNNDPSMFSNDFVNMCPSSMNNPMGGDPMGQHRFGPGPGGGPPNSCGFEPNQQQRYNNGFVDGPPGGYRPCSSQFNPNDGGPMMGGAGPPPPSQQRFANNSNCDPNKMRPMSNSIDGPFGSNSMSGEVNFPPIHDGPGGGGGPGNGPPPFPPNGQYEHPDNTMGSIHLQNLQKMTQHSFDMGINNKDGMMPNSKSMGPNHQSGPNHMNPMHQGPPPPPSSSSQQQQHPNLPQPGNHRMNPNASFDSQFGCDPMNDPNGHQFGHPPQPPTNMGPMSNYQPPSNNNFGSPRMAGIDHQPPPFGMPPQHGNNSFQMGVPMSNNGMMDPQNGLPSPSSSSMMMQQQQQGPPNRYIVPPGPRPPNNSQGGGGGGGRYNSPNVQVKPDAPNTIQYMPSRPQEPSMNAPMNRPPNLDFLQQSLSMNNSKQGPGGSHGPPSMQGQGPPPPNGPYPFPNNNSGGPMMTRGPAPPMQGQGPPHMNFNRGGPMGMRP